MRRKILFVYVLLMGVLFLGIYAGAGQVLPNEIFEYYQKYFIRDTAAQNAVTAIYLNYRVFDTMFEALMLLISIIGIIYFSRHEEGHMDE
ncbi:hypothetical protein [Petroclostridium sp. X23]|uniref:hypothetical protein n=1 Tax=Petroclostridium sp. X23 TaxID=3045146 RepID=UPI0024ADE13D|nr:hypothetical protein [Petroclostridium sp. X23]WHH57698.1 hypothetical protein QKW49_17960 [Petroclostridium sp. X23]